MDTRSVCIFLIQGKVLNVADQALTLRTLDRCSGKTADQRAFGSL